MKRNFWHCSDVYHGETFVAERRAPKIKADKEPSTPRLCVCPALHGCFAARLFRYDVPVYAYRTAKPTGSVAPKDTWDSVITRERWLIPPVTLVLVRTIDAAVCNRIQAASYLYLRQGLKMSWQVRLAQYCIARRALRDSLPIWHSDYFDEDPEEFILGKASC